MSEENKSGQVQIQIQVSELQKRKLFLAVPMYGGSNQGMFARSVMDLSALCIKYGISLQTYFLFNESLIPRARNYCCLPATAKIKTEDGIRTMKWIVDTKYSGKVLSISMDGKFSWNRVVNHWEKPNDEGKVWVALKCSNKRKQLIVTDDHKCLMIRDPMNPVLEYVQAKDTAGLYSVRDVNKAKNKAENPLYNQEQLSVLVGTLLGDGHLTPSGSLQINHSEKQHDYVSLLNKILGGTVAKTVSKKMVANGFLRDEYVGYRLTGPTTCQSKYLRDLFYNDTNDKVVEKVLPHINEMSLAFWYMDDGSYSNGKSNGARPTCSIASHSFTFEQHLLLQSMFKERWGIDVSIANQDDNHFLRFNYDNSVKLWDMIAKYIPSSMRYKLPETYANIPFHLFNTNPLEYSAYRVESVVEKKINSNLYDIEVENNHNFVANDTLVSNCDEFMRSDATHLMFIDSDIGFNPNDVIALLALASDDSPYDIIGGAYPKKCISWEKIKMAVDKGFADEDPNNLENFVGDYVFNPKGGQKEVPLGQPVEVLEIGTGFMMIRKNTMEKFRDAYPQYMYRPDHVRTEHFDGTREIMQFFQAEIDGLDFGQYYEAEIKKIITMLENDPDDGPGYVKGELENIIKTSWEEHNKKSKRYLSEDYWWCVASSTRIETPDGTRTIKDIVDSKYTGDVLSLDTNTGELLWKPVVNHWSRPNGKRGIPESKKKWVSLETDCDNNTKAKPKITEDHKVAIFDDVFDPQIRYVESKDTEGKYVVRNPQRSENPLYSSDQVSFLLGTLMGDSSINKSGQLTCQHSDQQIEYATLKANLFGGKLSGPVPNHGFGEGKQKVVMHAPVNAHTRKLRDMFYSTGKKTLNKIIDMIDEKALAFWYMDDGSLSSRGIEAYIATNSFSEDDHNLLQDMLKKRYDIDVCIDEKISMYKGTRVSYKSLRMNKEASAKFFDLIAKYIPPFMEYKLPTTHRGRNDKFDYSSVKPLGFAASVVKKVKYLANYHSRLYDIEVADTHNFVASGTVVHNCQKAHAIGLKTWLCPWMKLQHVGTMIFGGSLIDMAALGAPATADPTMLKKRKS